LHHGDEWVPIPEEEGNEAFAERLIAALTDIQAKHDRDNVVALVSHGGSLGLILAHLLGMDTRRPTPFRFGNTSLSIVEFTSHGPRLLLHNDLCHLAASLH
jgi:broad specificity phosphatase PhoE